METFNTQDRVAIYLGNDFIKHLLVRHEHDETFYSVQENNETLKTMEWEKTDEEDRASFFRFVDENLDSEGNARKSNLSEFILNL
jgi:hypothetical protein